jgi:ElaB/YqjD/DUF883 family membrane-anchored ribosome-binding protein
MNADTPSGSPSSAPTGRDNLADDMSRLRADVASLRDTLARLVSQGGEAARTARQAGESLVSHVGAAASDMAEAGSSMAASAKDGAQSAVSELEATVRRNPLGALAGALLVGVILGMMTRGRN